MEYEATENFKKRYKKLPEEVKKKVRKALRYLEGDIGGAGLRFKKMGRGGDWYELRVDRHYRISGEKVGNKLILEVVGMHDEGLGKK